MVFEPDEAEVMHQGVVDMLRDNPDVDVVTSYNKIDLLDLSGDSDEKPKSKMSKILSMNLLVYQKNFFVRQQKQELTIL